MNEYDKMKIASLFCWIGAFLVLGLLLTGYFADKKDKTGYKRLNSTKVVIMGSFILIFSAMAVVFLIKGITPREYRMIGF